MNMQGWQRVAALAIIVGAFLFVLWHGSSTDALMVLLAGLIKSPLFAELFSPTKPNPAPAPVATDER